MIIAVADITYDCVIDGVDHRSDLDLPTERRIVIPDNYCAPDALPTDNDEAMVELITKFIEDDWLVDSFAWEIISEDLAAILDDEVAFLSDDKDHFETLLGSLWQAHEYIRNSTDKDAARLPVVKALARHMQEVASFVSELTIKIEAAEASQ